MVLWGQGYYMDEPGRPWKLGGYRGQSGPDWNPILDGGANIVVLEAFQKENGCSDSVVCLADNNEIMGLTIQNGNLSGIEGIDVKNTNIHDNIIRWNDINILNDSGIHIANYFYANEVNGMALTYTIDNNSIYGNGGDGVHIETFIDGDDSDANYTISNVTLNNVNLQQQFVILLAPLVFEEVLHLLVRLRIARDVAYFCIRHRVLMSREAVVDRDGGRLKGSLGPHGPTSITYGQPDNRCFFTQFLPIFKSGDAVLLLKLGVEPVVSC